ncbi:hypothetical protein CBS147353_11500 [Aspergillus niger]|nr:hypothetical protein CBS147353_11500 [Aspergillus niger]GAA93083.1 similar to An04g07810 [Aspergillus luchuensis IFO 4308]
MKAHLPRLNQLRNLLASAEKKSQSSSRSNASHFTESALPDDRKPNFQAASSEGILTQGNGARDRDAMWEVDSVITNELPEHPNNVDDLKALASLICDLEARVRKLEEQVEDQNQENRRLHRRVSNTYESVPTSHTKSRRSARYKEMESE